MSWLKIDDGFPEHERVIDLSDRAFRLHVTALCQCAKNLTDGEVPSKRLSIINAIVSRPIKGAIKELVLAGLWTEQADGSYTIRDYLDYNPSAETVKEERRKARVRMQRSRERSGEHTANVRESDSGVCSPSPSRPVPSPTKGFSEKRAGDDEKPWDKVNLREIA